MHDGSAADRAPTASIHVECLFTAYLLRMTPGEHFVENRPQRCLEALSSREQAELSEKVCIVRGAGETKKLQDIAPPTLIKPLIPEGVASSSSGPPGTEFRTHLVFRVEPA